MNTKVFYGDLDERLEGEDAADALFALLLKEPSPELDARILELATLAINAEQAELADDDFMAMEAKADALFAPLVLDPPAMLDSRILDMAYEAIEAEEFALQEAEFDAMFGMMMVEPPPNVDKRILDLAQKAIKPSFVPVIVSGVATVAKKLLAANDGWFWGQEFVFYPRAAAAEESTDDTPNEVGGMLHAASPPGVDSFLLGEFTLLITTDFVDPTKKSMCIMVGGERAEIYEGCIVEVRKGESITLSGTIEFGQFEAPMPPDTRLEPPYTLNVRFPKNVEVVQQDTLE